MASPGDPSKQPGTEHDMLHSMLQQAEAAAESEHHDLTATERKHIGHDVPTVEEPTLDPQTVGRDVPQPAYGEHYGEVRNEQDGLGTDAKVGEDGRVNIRIKQSDRKLSRIFVPALKKQQAEIEQEVEPPPPYIPPSLGGDEDEPAPPPMNVVIQVVGSRGDVQPFVALGKVLRDTYGHRVRLATHPVFNEFVRENGLEFFSIGGDPSQLMAFMVKNPGLMPSFDSLRAGDVGKRRKEVAEYLNGCWRSCYEAGDGRGPQATNETIEDWTTRHPATGDDSNKPFVADCIIANPPSFAHVHVAEKMGIPLHIMFTMPYSPTQAFPHPLANIQSSNADQHLTNYISYTLIDMLTWQGLGDVINRFREKSLGLEPISLVWAPGMLQRLKIPHTYCWSPALIPKPKDWGQQINISGFFFLNLASNYQPAPDLQHFLNAGPPPVYIGFGSIVLDDPNAMTKLLFEAVEKSGQRALVSKGWGGMGADELGKPDNVFMLGNVPHDWLFKHVSCVVHHGGAGTTAAGITAGRPTVVIPFFGDQPFWGAMVARAGAGPSPIPHKELTADKLAEAIQYCLRPESQERAQELADKIASENGSEVGAQSFHQFLDVDKLRCNLSPGRAAVWRLKRTQLRLSAMAACTLANEGLLSFNDIKLFRPREYETDDGPWDPITGGATAIAGTFTTMMMGVADMPIDTLKALHIHPETAKKRKSTDVNAVKSDADSGPTSGEGESVSDSKASIAPTRNSISDTAATSEDTTPATSRSNSTFNVQESLAKLQSSSSQSPSRGGMPSSMADALRGQLATGDRPRSRSGSRQRSEAKSGPGPKSNESMIDTAIDTGKGVRKIVTAGFASPMDFSLSVAKGFHNAPKLYGDDTVRKTEPVRDFKSGLKAATKEFGYGMYDGITGLVTQPARGAAKEGAAGFFKGIGKGIGGIALKPGAAFFAIPGYTMKGVYKEMQKQFGSSVQNYIIAARTAQGYDDWQASTAEERAVIVQRWKALQKDLKKKRNPDEMVRDILEEQRRKKQEMLSRLRDRVGDGNERYWTPNMRRSQASSPGQSGGSHVNEGIHDPEAAMLAMGATERNLGPAPMYDEPGELDDDDLREAIRQSVQETSRGNAREDAEVEKAIQASLAEFQRSKAQASTATGDHSPVVDEAKPPETDGVVQDDELERALAASLKEQRGLSHSDGEASIPHSAADEEIDRQPIEMTEYHESETEVSYERDARHVEGTTKQQFEQSQSGEKSAQERNEEQIVMEYVKKQSLLEQQHRQGARAETPQRP